MLLKVRKLSLLSSLSIRSILAQAALALAIAGGFPVHAAQRCFDLKGVAAGASTGGIGVGGDRVVTDIPAGTTACDALMTWKANWDATPGNDSGPVTQRPDGTCDWCVTQQGGAKPDPSTGSIIGYLSPGFPGLSTRRVANPPPPPPPPPPAAIIKITIIVQFAAGGVIQISIDVAFGDKVQPFRMLIPTFPGESPDEMNAQILQTLGFNGFSVEMGSADFPGLGTQPAFAITGHGSGGTLVGGEVQTDDSGLDQWGISYEPQS